MAFVPPCQSFQVYIQKLTTLSLGGHDIDFTSSAEHVGIIRSVEGNMPNILGRISARNRAIMALLPTGMALSHRGNPAASLRLEMLYGTSVLLSGLGALVLDDRETAIIHHQHKTNLERLQRLFPEVSMPLVSFTSVC